MVKKISQPDAPHESVNELGGVLIGELRPRVRIGEDDYVGLVFQSVIPEVSGI